MFSGDTAHLHSHLGAICICTFIHLLWIGCKARQGHLLYVHRLADIIDEVIQQVPKKTERLCQNNIITLLDMLDHSTLPIELLIFG